MRVLVTGATGLVGSAIAKRLHAKEHTVRALVRDPDRARGRLPEEVELVGGDVLEPDTLGPAAKGVDWVFHAAGMPEQWQRDETVFDRVNRQGTANVLAAALRAGVARVVHTSSLAVFAAAPGGTLVETNPDPEPKLSAWQRSMQAADREVEAARKSSLNVVHVNPAAVYGPGPARVGVNSFIARLLGKKILALPPGGVSLAYVEGVADAHIAAAERGRSGERYLVADCHVSVADLAKEVARLGELSRVPPKAPAWMVKALAAASAPLARRLDFDPPVPPGELELLMWDVRVDATKARDEIGFSPTPLEEGIARTIQSLRS